MSDEAQADMPIPPPKKTEVESFSLTLNLNATVEVNGTDWIKPGVSGGMKWKSIPSPEEIKMAAKYIQGSLMEPLLGEILDMVAKQQIEKRRMM